MKRIAALVVIIVVMAAVFAGCAPTKVLHCDYCNKEVKVGADSNMEEDWIIYCEECNLELFGEDGLIPAE